MYIILVYDIVMENGGPRILRNVFKICKKYLQHVQCSVFEGELSPSQLANLKAELNRWLREDLDSVIIFQCRQEKWIKRDILGKESPSAIQFL